nr:gamma-aminobutyric acid type B receptor subunit 2 isoform X1 [Hydra vulgaris]
MMLDFVQLHVLPNIKQKMILTISWIFLMIINESLEAGNLEAGVLNIGVLIPLDDNCTRNAIEMAIEDIEKKPDMIFRNLTRYKLTAHFMKTDKSLGSAIEAQNRLYKTTPTKIATIGPPYTEQNDYCTEYSTAQGNLQISYTEANEPFEPYFVMYFQTPPSIVSSFIAACYFLNKFNWSRVAILFDYAQARYCNNPKSLENILENCLNKINLLIVQGIRSNPVSYGVSNEIGELQNKDVRIILALFSVSGARKVFCEAYNRKMTKPKVLWILFEILPIGWASDIFNAQPIPGGFKREINCSEEQLLDAAQGYISFTKQSLRKDNKTTLSNVTSESFLNRLNKHVDNKCDENLAYAYDAIWVAAMAFNLTDDTADLSVYSYNSFDVVFKLANSVQNVTFEGVTGPVSYQTQVSGGFPSRIGQISLYVFIKEFGMKLIGMHDTSSEVLLLEPEAELVLFPNNIVPKDQSTYNFYFSSFSNILLIIVWFFAIFGIVIAVLCLIFSLKYKAEVKEYSTLSLNGAIIIGSILSYLSVIIYGVDIRFVEQRLIPEMCYAFISLLSIGFTLTFGSLFSKVWRTYKLCMRSGNLSNKSPGIIQVQLQNVREWLLFVVVGSFLLIDIAILVTWRQLSPFMVNIYNITAVENLSDDTIIIEQVVKCTCNFQTEFTIGLYCYKGLLLLFGIFLVWQIKNINNKSDISSKNIGVAIYNVAAVSVTGVICVSILATTTKFDASYIIIAVCICICNTATLLLIFLPKILIVINSSGLIIHKSSSINNREHQLNKSLTVTSCITHHKNLGLSENLKKTNESRRKTNESRRKISMTNIYSKPDKDNKNFNLGFVIWLLLRC